MANILPYGMRRSSNGDPYSLKERARQQDIERGIQKDEEYYRTHGENRVFNDIPEEVVIPCNTSRLDVVKAGTFLPKEKNIQEINPEAYKAYLKRAKEIEAMKEQLEIEEYQRLLQEAEDNFVNAILLLNLDFLDSA
jgi:hypothetical protein